MATPHIVIANDGKTVISNTDDTVVSYLHYDQDVSTVYDDVSIVEGDWSIYNCCVGHYKMNDNAANTTIEDTLGLRNGTAQQNTSSLTTTGKINQAISFNASSDRISFGSTPPWITNTQGSIAFWWNPGVITGIYHAFLTIGGNGTNYFEPYAQKSGSNYVIKITSVIGGTNNTVSTTSTISGNTWHHIVITSNGSAWKIYIDTIEMSLQVLSGSNTGDWFGDISVTSPECNFGATLYNSTDKYYDFLQGKVDCLVVASRPITQDERSALYNGSNGTESLNGIRPCLDVLNYNTYDSVTTLDTTWNTYPDFLFMADLEGDNTKGLVYGFKDSRGIQYHKYGVVKQIGAYAVTTMDVGDCDDDGRDEIVASDSTSGKTRKYDSESGWTDISNTVADGIAIGNNVNGSNSAILIASLSVGVYITYNSGSSWSNLSGSASEQAISADLDGDGQDEFMVTFPYASSKIYTWDYTGGWASRSSTNPLKLFKANGSFTGDGKENIFVNFSVGLYMFCWPGTWKQLSSSSSATSIFGANFGTGFYAYCYFASTGYLYENTDPYNTPTNWNQLTNLYAWQVSTAGDFDGDSVDEAIFSTTSGKFYELEARTSYTLLPHQFDAITLSLDGLFEGILYDSIVITEVASVLDLIVELGVVYDSIAIAETLSNYLDYLFVSIYDSISTIEYFSNYLDVLNRDTCDLISIDENRWDVSSACISQYKMNDNADTTTVIDSVGSNMGTSARNTSLISTTGKIASAFDYNGISDYITYGADPSWKTYTYGSISCWIKMDTAAEAYGYLLAIGDDGTTNYNTIRTFGNSSKLSLQIVTRKAGTRNQVTTGFDYNANEWLFVVVTSDGSTWRAYINGTEVTLTAMVGSNTGDWFGDFSYTNGIYTSMAFKYGGELTQFGNGVLDNLCIYNRVLTSNEIIGLYNGSDGTESLSGSGISLSSLVPNIYDDVSLSENFSNYLDVLNIDIAEYKEIPYDDPDKGYDSEYVEYNGKSAITLVTDILFDKYLDYLFTSIYDGILITESTSVLDLVVELGVVVDTISISENLSEYLDVLVPDVYDSPIIVESEPIYGNKNGTSVSRISSAASAYFGTNFKADSNRTILGLWAKTGTIFNGQGRAELRDYTTQGSLGTLRASSSYQTLGWNNWKYFAFTTPYTVSTGTTYFLCLYYNGTGIDGGLYYSNFNSESWKYSGVTWTSYPTYAFLIYAEPLPTSYCSIDVLVPNIYDDISVTEYTEILDLVIELDAYDSLIVQEYQLFYLPIETNVYSDITIFDIISIYLDNLFVDLYDSLIVQEYQSTVLSISLDLYETITINEYELTDLLITIDVYDLLSTIESIELALLIVKILFIESHFPNIYLFVDSYIPDTFSFVESYFPDFDMFSESYFPDITKFIDSEIPDSEVVLNSSLL